MSALRFEFMYDTGASIIGHVQGAGGFVGSEKRLAAAESLARQGRTHGLYEPRPGCVAVFPRYSAHGNGEPEIVDLTRVLWRVVEF